LNYTRIVKNIGDWDPEIIILELRIPIMQSTSIAIHSIVIKYFTLSPASQVIFSPGIPVGIISW